MSATRKGRKEGRWEDFLQSGPCTSSTWRPKGVPLPSICVSCRSKDSSEPCRFEGFRLLRQVAVRTLEATSFGAPPQAAVDFVYPHTFDAAPDIKELSILQYAIAKELRPILQQELAACSREDTVFRHRERDVLVRCDYCNVSVLFVTFFCTTCAVEVCLCCYALKKQDDRDVFDGQCKHMMRPCSRMNIATLSHHFEETCKVLHRDTPLIRAPSTSKTAARLIEAAAMLSEIPRIRSGQEEVFLELSAKGLPVLIDVSGTLKGEWDPATLAKLHGDQLVTLVTEDTQGTFETPDVLLTRFLDQFSNAELHKGVTVKVKDWPTTSLFAETCRMEHSAYLSMTPFPSYTSPEGRYNIAAHFPPNIADFKSQKPDIGPKMYLATPDIFRVGSTALHLDETCALNILVHEQKDAPQTGAEWVIFRREDLDALRTIVRERYKHPSGDPILGHQYFLKDDDLQALASAGVRPFRFVQHRGEAVFINVGCAHQVSNLGGCIKIAADFLNADSLPTTMAIDPLFRGHRREDALLLRLTLWYGWNSVSQKIAKISEVPPTLTRKQRKNALRRAHVSSRDKKARKNLELQIASGSITRAEVEEMYKALCPHPDCAGARRLFPRSCVHHHLNRHNINLSPAQILELESTPLEQWSSVFGKICRQLQAGTS